MNEPSMLDLFAALAMQAILRERPMLDPIRIAEDAYDVAEAMVRESILRSQDEAH